MVRGVRQGEGIDPVTNEGPYRTLSEDGLELILFLENHGPLYKRRCQIVRRTRLLGHDEAQQTREWGRYLLEGIGAYRATRRAPHFFRAMEEADVEVVSHDLDETARWLAQAERRLMDQGEYDWLFETPEKDAA
jgi:hypothetical protein